MTPVFFTLTCTALGLIVGSFSQRGDPAVAKDDGAELAPGVL